VKDGVRNVVPKEMSADSVEEEAILTIIVDASKQTGAVFSY
jgi:hypothetical protein